MSYMFGTQIYTTAQEALLGAWLEILHQSDDSVAELRRIAEDNEVAQREVDALEWAAGLPTVQDVSGAGPDGPELEFSRDEHVGALQEAAGDMAEGLEEEV